MAFSSLAEAWKFRRKQGNLKKLAILHLTIAVYSRQIMFPLEKLLIESIIQTFWEKNTTNYAYETPSAIKSRTDTAARQRYAT